MDVWPLIDVPGRKIGYARVSTKDQKLRMQRDGLVAVGCERIYEDHGVSGATSSRPGLDELMADIRSDDAIVVFKLDRLGRSVLHLADLLTRLRAENIHFCSLSEGINTTTPGGKLVYHIFAAMAEFQREIIAENTRAGLEAARKRGKSLGRPPTLDIEIVLEAHRAVQQDGASIAETARRLGVNRTTLGRALERIEAE
ncbi:recombinase family protein [Celeribacter indicus]|uniref:Bacteriophage DNA-invertase n=1 Tax=Celeribacter indicus TaxID=1208324 RepID=A0A0B5DY82_9RHOB|nr:recombinase family protein [Celeribacter indicus]AJE47969.1 bacteriophage DNA-invertase [Celeribacter indicus]SDW28314.1 Site-specific DNA recombinase [Celeribacter indicus]